MKASNKKLLSLLVVVAMVLAMTPVITLPASAASPSEVQEWINSNADGFKDGGTLPATCPFCGDITATWTKVTEVTSQISAASNGNYTHIYFSGTVTVPVTYTGTQIMMATNNMCIYLNGATFTNESGGYVFRAGSGKILNIFGSGTVNHSGTSNFFYAGSGTINIYGGIYNTNETTFNKSGTTNIYGGTFNKDPQTLSNAVIAAGYEVTQSGSNYTVALPAGAAPPPETPEEKMAAVEDWQTTGDGSKEFNGTGEVEAFCPCCWDTVDWYPLPLTGTPPTSGHYYVDTDNATPDTTDKNDYTTTNGTLCLYLNNKNLIIKGRLRAYSTVNLIGNGTYTRDNTGSKLEMFYTSTANGRLNIYGGNYVNLLKMPIIKIGNAGAKINIYGGTFTGENLFLDEASNTSGEIAIHEAEIDIKAMNNYKNHNVIGMAVLNGHDSKWFMNEEAVVTYAAGKNEIITPYGTDMAMTLNGETVRVDCNGNTVTVKGTGTVNGFDSADLGTYNSAGGWVLDSGITIRRQTTDRGGNTYVTLDTANPATGSRTAKSYNYKLDMTAVTLRTSKAGMYFKTTLETSQALASRVEAYGVALNPKHMPTADWEKDGDAGSWIKTNEGIQMNGATSYTFNSGALVHILNEEPGVLSNKDRADVDVYANGYLQFDYELDGTPDGYVMAVPGSGEDVVYDLTGIMTQINTAFDTYEEDDKTAVHNFYEYWNEHNVDWNFDKIGDYVPNTEVA